jgi:hypothetical protein
MLLPDGWAWSARTVARIALVAALLRAGAAPAFVCDADVKKFCSDVKQGGGRIQACLKEHAKDLSPECAKRSQAAARTVGDMAAVCRPDIARLCAGVAAGQGRVLRCLEQYKDELSPGCKRSIDRTARPPAQ